MTETALVEVVSAGAIATVTIRRPERRNALNRQVIFELTQAFRSLEAESLASLSPRVVVLTGAGDKAFSAGVDIGELGAMTAAEAKRCADAGNALSGIIESAPFPVIAMVRGYALGGGFEVALACDFIYAAEGAKLGLPEVGLGVIPGFGGTQRLARRVGVARAREMVYTGGMVDATRAFAIGLVNEVVPEAELEARVRACADAIAAKGPLAIAQAKRVLLRGASPELSAAIELEAQAFAVLFGTDDQKEGMRAFLEKRAPRFTGR